MRGPGDQTCSEGGSFDVGVVGEDVAGQLGVFVGGEGVVDGGGGVVDRRDGDGDDRRSARRLTIRRRVGERV